MTNRQKLLEAVRLLSEARASLNQEKTPCPTCGVHVKQSWMECQAGEAIRGTRAKLERLLEHKDLQAWLDRR